MYLLTATQRKLSVAWIHAKTVSFTQEKIQAFEEAQIAWLVGLPWGRMSLTDNQAEDDSCHLVSTFYKIHTILSNRQDWTFWKQILIII